MRVIAGGAEILGAGSASVTSAACGAFGMRTLAEAFALAAWGEQVGLGHYIGSF